MSLPILKLSKPLSADRRKPRRRVTEIVAPAASTEATPSSVDPMAAEPCTGSTPEKPTTPNQIKALLQERYAVIRDHKPLACGAHKEILKGRDELWSHQKTKVALSEIMKTTRYLESVAAEGSVRYRLDGTVDGPVSDDHRQHARRLLNERAIKNTPDNSEALNESCDRDSGKSTTLEMRDG